MSFWIAIIILNTIALIAMLVARRELDRALSELRRACLEIDKLSSERSSERALPSTSLMASQRARFCQSSLWK